jgi:hypothetical protein
LRGEDGVEEAGEVALQLVAAQPHVPAGALDPGMVGFAGFNLLMFGAVTGWAIYTHGSGRFPEFSPLRYATLTAITGTSTILVLTVIADAAGWQHVPAVPDVLAIWPEIGYVVLIGAVLAILAWNTGVRRLGAANAALFMNLVPVVALALATVQGYRPRPVELLGVAITAAAIVTANLHARRTPSPVPAAPVTRSVHRDRDDVGGERFLPLRPGPEGHVGDAVLHGDPVGEPRRQRVGELDLPAHPAAGVQR